MLNFLFIDYFFLIFSCVVLKIKMLITYNNFKQEDTNYFSHLISYKHKVYFINSLIYNNIS